MRRILFVDDEPEALAALQRALHRYTHEWEMDFAVGGPEGLRRLAEARYDAVVTDMVMPQVSGSTVLETVKASQPWAVRLAISAAAHLDPSKALSAQRFLAKPVDGVRIMKMVEQACAVQSLLNDTRLRDLIGAVDLLPPAPGTFLALNHLMGDPKAGMSDVARIVGRDVGLTAKLIQLVNSAFFGLPRRVSNLNEACSLLGFATIRKLVLTVETMGLMTSRGGPALQRHSLLAAELARRLFPGDQRNADEAFMAALLHDVGCLIESVPEDQMPVEHARIGACLMALWGLPQTLVDTVALHERELSTAPAAFEPRDAVHISDLIASEVLGLHPLDRAVTALDETYVARMGMSAGRLAELRTQAQALVPTLGLA